MEFIARARQDIPALCATVRALRAEMKTQKVELLQLSGRGELLTKAHVNFDDLDPLEAVRNEFDRLRNIVIRDLQSQLEQVTKEWQWLMSQCGNLQNEVRTEAAAFNDFRSHAVALCRDKAAEIEALMLRASGPAFEDIYAQAGAQLAIVNELREALEQLK